MDWAKAGAGFLVMAVLMVAVLAMAIVMAGALSGASGGLYSIAGTGTGTSVVINRFTAKAWTCNVLFCEPLAFRNSK